LSPFTPIPILAAMNSSAASSRNGKVYINLVGSIFYIYYITLMLTIHGQIYINVYIPF